MANHDYLNYELIQAEKSGFFDKGILIIALELLNFLIQMSLLQNSTRTRRASGNNAN
jgi:hypothetical protein